MVNLYFMCGDVNISKYAYFLIVLLIVVVSGCVSQVPASDKTISDTQNDTKPLPSATPVAQPSVSRAPKQLYMYPNDDINFIYQHHNISVKYLSSIPQHKIQISIDGSERTVLQNRTGYPGDSGYYYTVNNMSISIRPVVWKSDFDNDGLVGEDPIDGIDNDGDGLIDEDTVNKIWSFETWDTDELYIEII